MKSRVRKLEDTVAELVELSKAQNTRLNLETTSMKLRIEILQARESRLKLETTITKLRIELSEA